MLCALKLHSDIWQLFLSKIRVGGGKEEGVQQNSRVSGFNVDKELCYLLRQGTVEKRGWWRMIMSFYSGTRGTTSRDELGQLEPRREGSTQCSTCNVLFSNACLLLSQGFQTETSGDSRNLTTKTWQQNMLPFQKMSASKFLK